MICVPIVAETQEGMAGAMRAAAGRADLVELRMDYAPGVELEPLLADRPCPVIVTCRPLREGGRYEGAETDRLTLLQRAVELGADYVDIEMDCADQLRRGPDTKLIVSHHDFNGVPDDLDAIHERLVAMKSDVAKIACMAKDVRDNLKVFRLLRNTTHPTIALAMGEAGMISRVLGRKFGNFLTFASLEHGRESAPGQLTVNDLQTLYHYKRIGPGTAVFGVIGNPIAHSMSPAIMNAAFDACGMDAVYLPFRVERDVVGFVHDFHEIGVRGYSVTIPHKRTILPAMDEVDDLVAKIGALNTVVNHKGRLHGTNTDVRGALKALTDALGGGDALQGLRVLLAGAGGAGRALAVGLVERGAEVVIANRTYDKGLRLAKEVGCAACKLDEVAEQRADILLNTTSVGMHPEVDASPVSPDALRPGLLVFDAVYNPLETKLLREAKAAGCRTVSGLDWFVNQAALQFELWTGHVAPRDIMEQIVRQRLER